MTRLWIRLDYKSRSPSNKGFTFWGHPILGNIQANMKYINLYSGVNNSIRFKKSTIYRKKRLEILSFG